MKKELKNILVPVDCKESSLSAMRFAANIAGHFKGELFLLNVIETPGLLADFFASGNHLVKITDQAKERLQGLARMLESEHPGTMISHRVLRGKPYEKILEVASEIEARFIILGENHQGADLRRDLGSTVYHVTLKSPVPVIAHKGDAIDMGKKILVPLDLTKETRLQLFSALSYALNYNASIVLVSSMISSMRIRDSLIYRKMRKAGKVLRENGVEHEIKIFEHSSTPPYVRVLEYAKEIEADMILVMTHQEGYKYDNYIGAFAHHIINFSNVPVLSLTSTATGSGLRDLMNAVVDPVGWFKK